MRGVESLLITFQGRLRVSIGRRLPAALLGGMLLLSAALPALAEDGPIVGTPPPQDAAAGWADTYAHPDYWEGYLREAAARGHFNLPYPFDPVKPETYLPNVPVPDGDYTSALPVDIDDRLSGLTYEWEGQTKTIEQFVRTTRTDAVILVVDGTVIGEWYANGYSPAVRHQPWSVTKTFVAAVVGVAFDEGRITSLDDPIEAYIPDLSGTAWEGVTIEQLLHMESGVHWDEGTPVLVVNTQVEQWVEMGLDLYTEGTLGATRNEFLAALPPAYEPGAEFRYNSGNTQVLAWLTEVLYDAPFNEVLAEKLWQPMGAAGDAVMTSDRVGGVIASHGLFARPHDFARFGELLRNGGRTPEGHQVVSQAWVEAMIDMTDTSGGQYGYQIWAHPIAGEGAYSASGFQGQKVTVVPDACLTGVRLSHALGARLHEGDPTDPDGYGFAVEFYAAEWQTLLRAVAEEFGHCPDTAADAGPDTAVEGTGSEANGDAVIPDRQALPATGAGTGAFAGLAMLLLAVLARRTR